MQGTVTQKLLHVLSTERLDAYRGKPPQPIPDQQLFARYLWNMALSESLYPTLQVLEVALRNTLHHAASAHFGRTDWFDAPGVLQHFHERDAIQKAKTTLTQQGKPLNAGRIIAELSFGFWTSLLDRRYEQTLWPRLLKAVFPHLPRTQRTRAHLSKRFHTVRQLRNRVFHHEPIWHWKDLVQQHQDILEALAWIEPAACQLVQPLDRFPALHQQGPGAFEQALAALIQQTP